jgi:hypothetical protein
MNGLVYDSSTGAFMAEDSPDGMSFVQSYSCGDIDVGGEDPPEAAKRDIPDILLSGSLPAPIPPDDDERVRELYVSLNNLMAQISIQYSETIEPR